MYAVQSQSLVFGRSVVVIIAVLLIAVTVLLILHQIYDVSLEPDDNNDER